MAAVARDRTNRGMLYGAVCLVGLAVVVAAAVLLTSTPTGSDNPFAGKNLYVYPHSSAAVAAAGASGTEGAAFADLAAVPTAIWLLPEQHPAQEVTSFITAIESDAQAKFELPVFVVYGIPSRDCGNLSAGGLSAADYPVWISAITTGIANRPTVVILEPDAIALSSSCGTESETAAYLQDAITRLSTSSSTTIYLDGGHSSWLSAESMAPLLIAAGVDRVRGFVTNVSNFNSTSEEQAFGGKLSDLLGGAHYVVDVSRNGAGSNGEWCNPSGRRVGHTPSRTDDATPQDASLWIKNPGESDGTCNGGPAAGQWWPKQALELVNGT